LDFFDTAERKTGKISEIDEGTAIINCNGIEYLCDEIPGGLSIGSEISFLINESNAYDVIVL
jgi:hypothetical protein